VAFDRLLALPRATCRSTSPSRSVRLSALTCSAISAGNPQPARMYSQREVAIRCRRHLREATRTTVVLRSGRCERTRRPSDREPVPTRCSTAPGKAGIRSGIVGILRSFDPASDRRALVISALLFRPGLFLSDALRLPLSREPGLLLLRTVGAEYRRYSVLCSERFSFSLRAPPVSAGPSSGDAPGKVFRRKRAVPLRQKSDVHGRSDDGIDEPVPRTGDTAGAVRGKRSLHAPSSATVTMGIWSVSDAFSRSLREPAGPELFWGRARLIARWKRRRILRCPRLRLYGSRQPARPEPGSEIVLRCARRP
jgi:hypothetical protein